MGYDPQIFGLLIRNIRHGDGQREPKHWKERRIAALYEKFDLTSTTFSTFVVALRISTVKLLLLQR